MTPRPPETERTLLRGGQRLAWRATTPAPAGRDAVLLLHGLASNATRWSEFVEHTALAAERPVLRVDLRGHGASQPAGRATLDDWCDDLAAILNVEQIARALFIGHSLGAQVALHAAAASASRVAGLVLIDPVFRAALRPRWARIARLWPLFAAGAAIVRAANAVGLRRREVVPDDLRALDAMAREALADPAREAEFIRRYSSTRADLRQFRLAQYLQDLVEMFRPTPALASIRVPVLVLLSSGATFADPGRMRELLRALPQGEVAQIECHHWPLTEKPAEVRQAVEAWIATQFPPR